jgi:hypothetical protein
VIRKLLVLCVCVLLGAAGCGEMKYPMPTKRPTITPRPPTAEATVTMAVQVLLVVTSTPAPAGETLPGNPAAGDVLFHTFQPGAGIACTGCHRVDSDTRLIGPGLKSIGVLAQSRVPGVSAQEYIRMSIIDPSAFVVEGYPNLVPKNWGIVFSEQQVNDLVAYLMSLSQS